MEENTKEIADLIGEFTNHTKVIETVNENFTNFMHAYKQIKESLEKLNIDIKSKQNIEKAMNDLVDKGTLLVGDITVLSQKVNKLESLINPIAEQIENLNTSFKKLINFDENVQAILNSVSKTNETIDKLDLKQITTTLESYNQKMEQTKTIFEQDVKKAFNTNNARIDYMLKDVSSIVKNADSANTHLEELVKQQVELQTIISKLVDKNTFQMEYLYDVLDKWAEERKVKLSKK
ncbi:MAG: hypothetical protein WCX32_04715 [Clostridia bacterium]|jgi:ABC-type transporter Mla subunit MlaD|nr:hypothetical protein [Clostridia bacterium]MDD4275552.1 hypothetical protein [Clostridia bacterium]